MQGMITRRCLDDIASALRLRTHTSGPIAPNDMPAMVSRVYGPPMEMPERSNDSSIGLVSDSCMSAIADAIRGKLGTDDLIAPKDMADAILSIDAGEPFDLIKESTEIARCSTNNTGSGVNTKTNRYDTYAYYFSANQSYPAGYIIDSVQTTNSCCMLNAPIPSWCTRLYLYVESNGARGDWNTSTVWFRSAYGVTGRYGGNYAGENLRDAVTLTRYTGNLSQTLSQEGVKIEATDMYVLPRQVVEIDISGITEDAYVGIHHCSNRTIFYGMVAAWEGFDILSYLGVS